VPEKLSKLKKNNSNLYECEDGVKWNGPLWRAVRKERWGRIDYAAFQEYYLLLTNSFTVDDWWKLELRLDVDSFKKTLDGKQRQALDLFLRGYPAEQAATILGVSRRTAFLYQSTILKKFKMFCAEN